MQSIMPLCEMCPNTKYLSVFSPNEGKYGPEKTPYMDTFHAVCPSQTVTEWVHRFSRRREKKQIY